MKRKKTNWDLVAWTPFQRAAVPDDQTPPALRPAAIFINSRYQVSVWEDTLPEPFGDYAHLSIKTLDKSARHDWRDFQRIKNEICGPECEAVELYPAESRLVDGANQFHVWVFRTYKLPFGFNERLVSDGNWRNSRQRSFPPGERPVDCLNPKEFEALYQCRLVDPTKVET